MTTQPTKMQHNTPTANDTKVVVTRHSSYIDHLLKEGIIKENQYHVIEHANPGDIRGKHIITSGIPLHLAVLTESVSVVPLNLPPELRGKELTLEEVSEHAGPIQLYSVKQL